MATGYDFALFVCDQIGRHGEVTMRKMFGEYMIYVNQKPLLLLCDNTVYVKKLDCLLPLLDGASTGKPYSNAKEHYILDIENASLVAEVVAILETVISVPVKKPRKNKSL